jgi:hypothetical protein
MATNHLCGGCTGTSRVSRRTWVVCEAADLEAIGIWMHRYDSIQIRLLRLRDSENFTWTARLQEAYHECGCTLGAYCLAGALASTSMVGAVRAVEGLLTFDALRIGFLVVIGSAMIGKLVGIVAGRFRAAFLIRRLQAQYTNRVLC